MKPCNTVCLKFKNEPACADDAIAEILKFVKSLTTEHALGDHNTAVYQSYFKYTKLLLSGECEDEHLFTDHKEKDRACFKQEFDEDSIMRNKAGCVVENVTVRKVSFAVFTRCAQLPTNLFACELWLFRATAPGVSGF